MKQHISFLLILTLCFNLFIFNTADISAYADASASDVYTQQITGKHKFYINNGGYQVDSAAMPGNPSTSNLNLSPGSDIPADVLIMTGSLQYTSTGIASSFDVKAGSKEVFEAVEIKNGAVYMCDSNTAIASFDADVTYNFTIMADSSENTISFSMEVRGGTEIVNKTITISDSEFDGRVSRIRFWCDWAPSTFDVINVSNIKAFVSGKYPEITKVTSSDGISDVAFGSNQIICHLAGYVKEISKEDITVENDLGKVAISSAELVDSKTIRLSFEKPLNSAYRYTISLNDEIPLLAGKLLGKTITGEFTTSSNGYAPPELFVSSPSDASTIYAGDTLSIKAQAQSHDLDISHLEFYVDGELKHTDNVYPYSYDFSPTVQNTHEITVIAYDSQYGVSLPESITVTVLPLALLSVSIEGVTDSAVYSPDSALQVSLSVEKGRYDIAYTELYLNSKCIGTKTSDPYVFELSELGIGQYSLEAIVYDESGKTAQDCVSFVVSDIYTAQLNGKHTFYIGGKSYKEDAQTMIKNSNMNLAPDSSITEGAITLSGSLKYTSAEITSRFEIVAGEQIAEAIELKNGSIYMNKNKLADASFEAGKTYNFIVTADGNKKTIKLVLADDKGTQIVNESITISSSSFKGAVTRIRFWCDKTPTADDSIYVSNIKAYVSSQYPYISSVTSSDGVSDVEYGEKSVICHLSGALGKITTDNVTVENDLGNVALSSAELVDSKTLKINFVNTLDSSTSYRVTLDEKTLLLADMPSGKKIKGEFVTTSKPFDVTEGSFKNLGGVNFTAEITNAGEARNVTVVLVVYENGIIKSLTARTALAATGTTSVTTPKFTLPLNNPSAEAFVIDSFESQLPVSSKLFKYN